MQMIAKEKGILIYLRQEGRGIGIINKLRAYQHQERGLDTIQANEALGLASDYREYDVAANLLREMSIHKVRLITNNPDKIKGLEKHGLKITELIPSLATMNSHNTGYMKTKFQKGKSVL